MTEGREDPLVLSEKVILLQKNGDLPQSISKLRLLQTLLMEIDRWQLNPSVLWNLCGIIQGEMEKWTHEEVTSPLIDSLRMVSCALCCLRNAFPNCSRNQLLVAETPDLLEPVISCIQWTFRHEPKTSSGRVGGSASGSGEALTTLASACVTCLGNLVAANPKSRRIIWPHFLETLEDMLVFPDKEVAQMSTMTLYNCMLEEDLKEQLGKCFRGRSVMSQLLSLYEADTKYSCFVLLSLEVMLTSEGLLAGLWSSLSGEHQQLCLEVVEAGLTDSSRPLCGPQGTPTLTFLVGVFKSEADNILRNKPDLMNPESAQVLAKLGNFVCSVAASDTWRPHLQRDQSLLVTSVELLSCLNEVGKDGDNAFTPLDRFTDLHDEERMAQVESHPAFGFKCDLIRLTASLVFLNKSNQDRVREVGGLLLLLESSKFDARNPLIKEASIFALRNLLEGNLENQRCVGELRLQGVTESPGLAELGMEAVQEGEKVRLVQRRRSLSRSPPPEL